MTEEELHLKMEQLCIEEDKQSGWWIFKSTYISFEKTEFEEECDIQIIQQLPEEICFPKRRPEVIINAKGIKTVYTFYSWENIITTGIKLCEYRDDGYIPTLKSILLGYSDGKIIEIKTPYNIDYTQQLGHFIELYKLKFRKQNSEIKNCLPN